jgi:hypothetical protein
VRRKAELLLEDIRDRVQQRRTPEERERKVARHMKMRELNRRGKDPENRRLVHATDSASPWAFEFP